MTFKSTYTCRASDNLQFKYLPVYLNNSFSTVHFAEILLNTIKGFGIFALNFKLLVATNIGDFHTLEPLFQCSVSHGQKYFTKWSNRRQSLFIQGDEMKALFRYLQSFSYQYYYNMKQGYKMHSKKHFVYSRLPMTHCNHWCFSFTFTRRRH